MKAKVRWNPQIETVLQEWAEKAQSYRWLHHYSFNQYYVLNMKFIVPIVILNSLAGISNFGLDAIFPEELRKYAILGVGAISILSGLLTTMSQYLQVPQTLEGHRQASISWGKFHRNLKTELALPQSDRAEVNDFLKFSRNELDRLLEQGPLIKSGAIQAYQRRFKMLEGYNHPEICNGLHNIDVFRDPTAEVLPLSPVSIVSDQTELHEEFHDASGQV